MVRTVSVDAARWGRRADVEIYAGEPLHFAVENRAEGDEIVVTVAADHDSRPLLDTVLTEAGLLTDAVLAPILARTGPPNWIGRPSLRRSGATAFPSLSPDRRRDCARTAADIACIRSSR